MLKTFKQKSMHLIKKNQGNLNMPRQYLSKAREKASKLKAEFKKQTVIAILAALAFLIALSWRDFISDSVNKIVESLGVSGNLYLFKLFSALIVTFLAVLGILIISRFKTEENQ